MAASILPATNAAGVLGAALQVDLSKARVPDRRYAADVCYIARVRGELKLMFGQERVDGAGWRTLLSISMGDAQANLFLSSTREMKNPSLEEIVAGSNVQPEELSTGVSEPSQANQAVSLVANFVLLAISSGESTLDFYHASAFALSSVAQMRSLSVDPVVRVDLRTSLLLGMIARLSSLVKPAEPFQIGSPAS